MPTRFNARYDKGLLLVLMVPPALPLARAGFLLADAEIQLAWALLGVTGLTLFALWSILPRAYELWPDRIRVVLGWPFGLNVPLNTVADVQPAHGVATWFRLGAMWATSFKTPVRINRSKGMTIVLSPVNPAEFVEAVRDALVTHRRAAQPLQEMS